MKSLKQICNENTTRNKLDIEIDYEILKKTVRLWLEQKRPKKQCKTNIWTSSEIEQDLFINELLEELR